MPSSRVRDQGAVNGNRSLLSEIEMKRTFTIHSIRRVIQAIQKMFIKKAIYII